MVANPAHRVVKPPGEVVYRSWRSPLLLVHTSWRLTGTELWKSDGTESGTVLVEDINPGGSSFPQYLTNVAGTLFFFANDGNSGQELWKSDGTATGTVLVKDDSLVKSLCRSN